MADTLPDDLVRDILLRVPTDAAALFRCAATCKQWRAVVADLSFLQHHWPENACHPSSLLGFFDRRRRDKDQEPSPYFNPVSPTGSMLGARGRSLASIVVSGAPGGILDDAVPVAARGNLLLVRLIAGSGDSLRLAICDVLTRTCDVLPPLECWISRYGCAILAREDCCSMHGQTPLSGYSTFFKVLAMVTRGHDHDCSLYIFSSSEPNWSEPRKCFDQVWRDKFDVQILPGSTNRVAVCHDVAYWLGSYSKDEYSFLRYFTFGVNVKTGQISITNISTPGDQLETIRCLGLTLSVSVGGRLSLLQLQSELREEGFQLNTWTQGDDRTWLRTRVIELKPHGHSMWIPVDVAMLSGEKSGVLFMADLFEHVYRIDTKTEVMEEVTQKMFQGCLTINAVPIEIDWPTLLCHA